jgi:hypothetical protein
MSMSDGSFEFILRALRNQKQRLEELQAENSELHQQLTDLRNGHGIFVEILGTRFALVETQPGALYASTMIQVQDAPTMQIAQTITAPTLLSMPETPRTLEPVEESSALQDQVTEEISQSLSPAPSFLEEVDEDDFLRSVTSPIAIWSGTETNPRQKPVEEDENAALRRQLIGSFLLE